MGEVVSNHCVGLLSQHKINMISSGQKMIIKKYIQRGSIVDPKPNSRNQHLKSCMVDSKETY